MDVFKNGFTIPEAVKYSGIGENTLRELIGTSKLPVLRIGRKILIRREILDAFMLLNEGKNLREDSAEDESSSETLKQE